MKLNNRQRAKLTLDELEKEMEILTKEEMNACKGGGYGTFNSPWSLEEFYYLESLGIRLKGYVTGPDGPMYVETLEPVIVVGNSTGNKFEGMDIQNKQYMYEKYQAYMQSSGWFGFPSYPYEGGGGSYQQTNNGDKLLSKIFGNNSFSASDWDFGAIGSNTFNNPYSANGSVIYRIKTDSNMKVNMLPVLINDDGNYSINNLQGFKLNITISGNVIAPYMGVDIQLSPIKMLVNGEEIKLKQFQTPQYLQGGTVPSLPFETFIDLSTLRKIHQTSGKISLVFEGRYVDKNSGAGMNDAATNIIPNTTNLTIEIPINSF